LNIFLIPIAIKYSKFAKSVLTGDSWAHPSTSTAKIKQSKRNVTG
jgi:hypothetical protein